MDFFSRARNDEFLIILPGASKEITQDVISRITTAFFGRRLTIDEDVSTEIELNFGWAAFGEDGETAGQLLKTARLRKSQSKNASTNKVLWFNREMIG
jgi:GGDEF domain-containing protein